MERYLLPIQQLIIKKDGEASSDIAAYVSEYGERYPVSGIYIIAQVPKVQYGGMELSIARTRHSAVTFGDCVIFGPGEIYNAPSWSAVDNTSTIDVFSDSLSRLTATAIGNRQYAAVVLKDYVIFGGGRWSVYASGRVGVLDPSLTYWEIEGLPYAISNPHGAAIGNYALIGGAGEGNWSMTSYDSALTRGIPSIPELSIDGAVSLGEYAIFAGFTSSDGGNTTPPGIAYYDSALTLRLSLDIGGPRFKSEVFDSMSVIAVTNNHALFAGLGENNNEVWLLDTALTRTKVADLSEGRIDMSATTVGEFILVGGGGIPRSVGYTEMFDTVDIYDRFFTRIGTTQFSQGQSATAAANTSKYAFFGGGIDWQYREGVSNSIRRTNAVHYFTFE